MVDKCPKPPIFPPDDIDHDEEEEEEETHGNNSFLAGSSWRRRSRCQSLEDNDKTKVPFSLPDKVLKPIACSGLFIGPRSDHSLPMSVTDSLSQDLVE